MKTLINITAHAYDTDGKIVAPERTYSFVRSASASAPSTLGAERMVARQLEIKPSLVSVTRVEAMCYDAR
jgi:hypothetical protein